MATRRLLGTHCRLRETLKGFGSSWRAAPAALLLAVSCTNVSGTDQSTLAQGGTTQTQSATGGRRTVGGTSASAVTITTHSTTGGQAIQGGSGNSGVLTVGGTPTSGGKSTQGVGGAPVAGSGLGGTLTAMGGASHAGQSAIGGKAETGGTGNVGTASSGGTSSSLLVTQAGGTSAGGTTAIGATTTGGIPTTGGTQATGGSNTGSSTGGVPDDGVTVHLDHTHQTIEGFGINDTWASDALPSRLFTTSDADSLGLSILRVGMGDDGKDFSSNIAGDITMAAKAGAKIIGTCWSAPASCKDNNLVGDSGHLLPSCYESWSDTIVAWAKGHSLYAMSIASEPDFKYCIDEPCSYSTPSTLFTANELVTFVKVAGPKLQQAGIKVIAPETAQWNHLWSNVSAGPDLAGYDRSDPLQCGSPPTNPACTQGDGYDYGHWLAKDSAAWAAFDIVGTHQYYTQVATPWPSDVTASRKPVWQTEMSGLKWWPEQGPSKDIANGVAVAGWIHSALVTGQASAWLWWWYKVYGTDDNEGLLLKDGSLTKRYYTLGNYSKFVRPGYVRVDVAGNDNPDLLLSAFTATDGTVVIVAINKSTTALAVPITLTGAPTAPTSMTSHVTSSTANLQAGAAISVNQGTFVAALGATTVTTFVGGTPPL